MGGLTAKVARLNELLPKHGIGISGTVTGATREMRRKRALTYGYDPEGSGIWTYNVQKGQGPRTAAEQLNAAITGAYSYSQTIRDEAHDDLGLKIGGTRFSLMEKEFRPSLLLTAPAKRPRIVSEETVKTVQTTTGGRLKVLIAREGLIRERRPKKGETLVAKNVLHWKTIDLEEADVQGILQRLNGRGITDTHRRFTDHVEAEMRKVLTAKLLKALPGFLDECKKREAATS